MEPRKYHNIRLSRAKSEFWKFLKEKWKWEAPILIVGTVVNYNFNNINWWALCYEIWGVLFLTCVMFLWKSLRVVPECIYNEQQGIIDSQWETIDSLEEQQRPKLEVTFEQGVHPWFQKGHWISGDIYRIGIKNPGTETVRNVTVQLTDIVPYPEDCDFTMPFCLRFTNESATLELKNLQTSMTLFVDVFCTDSDSDDNMKHMEIRNTVGTEPEYTFFGIDVPIQSYEIEVTVNSDNGGEPIIKRFRFDPNKEDAKDMMEMID